MSHPSSRATHSPVWITLLVGVASLANPASAQETRRYRLQDCDRGAICELASLADLASSTLSSHEWTIEPLGALPLTVDEERALRDLPACVTGLCVTTLEPAGPELARLLGLRPWRVLDFSRWNDLTDDLLCTLPRLETLRAVYLDSCIQVSDRGVLAVLAAAPHATALDLSLLPKVTDKTIAALDGRGLEALCAGGCWGLAFSLDDGLLASVLRDLRILELPGLHPAPALFKALSQCTHLELVDLTGTSMTDDELECAFRSSPGPLALRVSSCYALTDRGFSRLRLPLRELSADEIPGLSSAAIRQLVERSRDTLRTLSLVGCQGVTSVSQLGELRNLESLDLMSCTAIDDLDQVEWQNLRSLEFLSVAAIPAADGDLAALLRAPALVELRLAGTLVTNGAGRLIAAHPTLSKVDLAECAGFGDEGLLALAASPQLADVQVERSAVTKDAVSPLLVLRPALKVDR